MFILNNGFIPDILKMLRKNLFFLLLLLLLMALPFFIYLNGGFSQDEGNFLFVGDRIAHGSILYSDYVDNKPPGIFFLSGLISIIFGKSIIAARCLVFLANAISAILLFYIGKELFSKDIGKLSSILFLLGVLVPSFEGYYFLTETFMILFGLLGILLYINYKNKTTVFLSGFFIGIAILFKQTGLLLLLVIIIGFIVNNFYLKQNDFIKKKFDLLILIAGVATPIIVSTLYFFKNNNLAEFIYWTIISLGNYYKNLPIMEIFNGLKPIFLQYNLIWILSGITITIIVYSLFTRNSDKGELLAVIWIFIFIPTFIVRQFGHYVIQILPPICLLASISLCKLFPFFSIKNILDALSKKDFNHLYVVLTIILFASSSLAYSISSGSQGHERRVELLKEQVNTADYIIQHTSENESILVFSYNPSIYFLTGRNPPIKYVILNDFMVSNFDKQDILKKLDGVNYVIINDNSTKPEIIYDYIIDNYHDEISIGPYAMYYRNKSTK